MDLRERLDRELAEPSRPAPDLSDTLVAGRRAVRRRRVVAGVAGLMAATVLGGMGWLLAPNDEPSLVAPEPPSPEIAVDDDPSNDCHEVPASKLDACRGPVVGGRDSAISIYYVPDRGAVRRDPGVRVLKTIVNPLGSDEFNAAYEVDDNGMRLMLLVGSRGGVSEKAGGGADDLATWVGRKAISRSSGMTSGRAIPGLLQQQWRPGGRRGRRDRRAHPNPLGLEGEAYSIGLAVEHDGQTTWMLLSSEPGSETISSSPGQHGFATLEDWIDDSVAANQGRDAHPFVEFNDNGTLRPLPRVEIVEQRRGVDLGSFPPESTVVAQLLVDGEPWFVAACQCGGNPEYRQTNTSAAGETLDDYIAYYRASNASVQGVQ